MKQFSSKFLSLLMTLFLVAGLVGCASKQKSSSADESSSLNSSSNEMTEQEMDKLALELQGSSDAETAGALKTVYFPFDSSQLTGELKDRLDLAVKFLKYKTNVKVEIEGHCDERGSVQYNLALGERRALAVKNYLMSKGIAAGRLSTVSFGKERPKAFGHSEDAWAQNRRGNFVITKL